MNNSKVHHNIKFRIEFNNFFYNFETQTLLQNLSTAIKIFCLLMKTISFELFSSLKTSHYTHFAMMNESNEFELFEKLTNFLSSKQVTRTAFNYECNSFGVSKKLRTNLLFNYEYVFSYQYCMKLVAHRDFLYITFGLQ